MCVPEQMGLNSSLVKGFHLFLWLFGWFLGFLDGLLGTGRVSDCPVEDCMK